jgi:hypothetical protein
MNFLKKSNGDALSRASKKNFSFSSSILQLATFTSLITFAATPARADYYDAKLHFESLSVDDRSKAILGLESTGDFNGLTALGYTERFFKAILAFETKNNLEVDGKLQPLEISRLASEGRILFNQVGFTDYKNEKVGSTLWVPRKLFDSEKRINNGINFQRADQAYTLSFVAHTNDQSTFENLFEVIRSSSETRAIDYQRIRDNFFVVTGTNKGRKFYTYMERIQSGTTGFTLTYKTENSILADKLATVLANTFIATPETAAKKVEPPQPEPVAMTQNENIAQTPLVVPTSTVTVAPIAAVTVVSVAPPIGDPQLQSITVVQVATPQILQQPIAFQSPQPIVAQTSSTEPRTVAPSGNWRYTQSVDKMRDSTNRNAINYTTTILDFKFPYNGGTIAALGVREKNHVEEVTLSVRPGQFQCNGQLDDEVTVKFDNGGLQKYKCFNTEDGAMTMIFLEDSSKFLTNLKNSKHLTIEVAFYQEGRKQLEFDTSNLQW